LNRSNPSKAGTLRSSVGALWAVAALGLLLGACSDDASSTDAGSPTTTTASVKADLVLDVDRDEVLAEVDPRFQSYNIEMVEVTGGYFWPPYEAGGEKVYREPLDLSSERLRNLARALGPSYIRVSGTWANSTYFDPDGAPNSPPPEGFEGVLTGDQWKGVGEFASAVDGEVMTSFASNTGVRDGNGAWVDDQARALLQFSVANEVPLAAAELVNEPNLALGVPSGYDAETFAADFAALEQVVADELPDLKLVGPGSADDVTPLVLEPPIRSSDMLELVSPAFDAFSFHFYPKVSERCGSTEGSDVALSDDYLSRIEADKEAYTELRDTYEPGAPLWLTETAQAACGGDRWATEYRDVIRYVDTLGRMADGDGNVVFHNTLSASDYGLLDEEDLTPRPNYWGGVLWRRLMGSAALTPDLGSEVPELTVYAHCTAEADRPSVTYAVLNRSVDEARTAATGSGSATVYQLTGESLDASEVALNGEILAAAEDGTLPDLVGKAADGAIDLPPASVTFIVEPTDAAPCS
jgi:hypothetical protein